MSMKSSISTVIEIIGGIQQLHVLDIFTVSDVFALQENSRLNTLYSSDAII